MFPARPKATERPTKPQNIRLEKERKGKVCSGACPKRIQISCLKLKENIMLHLQIKFLTVWLTVSLENDQKWSYVAFNCRLFEVLTKLLIL